MADEQGSQPPLCALPLGSLGHGWNDLRRHEAAVDDLVSGGVVCDGTKHGVSALGLQRLLGLGSYESAWALLHKLRRAMVRPGRDRLAGEVEVDETAIGPSRPGRIGRGTFLDRAIVAIAVEERPRGGCGRIRLARIPNCSGSVLSDFVCGTIEPGAVVCTDHWQGYGGLAAAGFIHQQTSIAASGDPAHVVMPRARTASPRCSSAGCSAPIKAPPDPTSSTSTSTSSRSASTATARASAASSSTGCSSRRSRSTMSPSPRSPAGADERTRGVIRIPRCRHMGASCVLASHAPVASMRRASFRFEL